MRYVILPVPRPGASPSSRSLRLQVDLKDDPQLRRGEMRVYTEKKQDITKEVVGAVPGT